MLFIKPESALNSMKHEKVVSRTRMEGKKEFMMSVEKRSKILNFDEGLRGLMFFF